MKKYLAVLISLAGVGLSACTGGTNANNTTPTISNTQVAITNQNSLSEGWTIKAAAIRSTEYLFNSNITGTVCDLVFETLLDISDDNINTEKISKVENSLNIINGKLDLLMGEFSKFEKEWQHKAKSDAEQSIYSNINSIDAQWSHLYSSMHAQAPNNGENNISKNMTLTQFYEQDPMNNGEWIKNHVFSGKRALDMGQIHQDVMALTNSTEDSTQIQTSQHLGSWLTAINYKYVDFKYRSQIDQLDIANENAAYNTYLRKTIMQIAISVDKGHNMENQVMELYCKHPEEFQNLPGIFTFTESGLSSHCADDMGNPDGGKYNMNILNSYYKNYALNLTNEVKPNIKSFKQIESAASVSDKIKYSPLIPTGSYLQSCHMLESNAGVFKNYNGDSMTIVCSYNDNGHNTESIELSYSHVADCTNNGGLQLTKDGNNNYILACQNGYKPIMPCNNISKDEHHNCIIEEKENIDSYYDLPTQYSLYQGQEWDGPNGDRLAMQTDGNLVFYSNSSLPRPLQGLNIQKMIFQPNDGNLVRYSDGGFLYALPDKHYDTNEGATDRAQLVLQDDGNLVTYNPGQDTWSLKQDPSSN